MTDKRTANLGRALCLGGGSLGALVLFGWFEGMQSLCTVVPGRPAMAPDAAFALLLLGLAGALLNSTQPASTRRLFAKLLGGVVIVVGVEIAVRYALRIHLPFDHVFLRNHALAWGRSPPTAAALIFLGAAIVLFEVRLDKRARLSKALILCASFIAITALLGYLYGADTHYVVRGAPISSLTVTKATARALRLGAERLTLGVAVPGALGGLMICVGLLLERPDSEIMRVFIAPGPGGALMKRLTPAAILIPVVLGFVAARLPGIEDVPLTFAALTAITTLSSLFLLGITAVHLNRAHESLRISEAKFAGMVSTSADAIISVDEAQRITLFNAGAEKIFGYSSAEMIGVPLDILIPKRYREIHARHLNSFMAGPDCSRPASAPGRIYGLRRNDEEFPAGASISKLSVGGKSIVSVTLRDMTESNRLYQSAIQASRSRDEVLGIVAHDLRNPLQIITINARLLRRSGPEPTREMAAEIGAAADRMNRFIQDLLDVTSIESGHLSLRPERLDVGDIISEVVHRQTPLAESALLDLIAPTELDLPNIWADRDRLLQVFENLVGNAIKFTKAGGHITLGAVASTGEVVFSVWDNGSGIADTNLPHVFDRFWQASHGAHRGAGLGLAVVKGIVESHGGHVWVRSSVGRGTTFFFSIPIAPQARQRPDARAFGARPAITG